MFGPGLPGLFLVHVSFGPGTFNGQDPPLQLLELHICQTIQLTHESATISKMNLEKRSIGCEV
ncbi:hypothetical protein Hanom_Chr13g01227321 [Helianthus anomalus]